MSQRSAFATVNQITLHYRLEGQRHGTPLLFLHSLGSDLRIWDGVAAPLADHFPIIRYDLRGHGLSDAPLGPYTIQDHVNDLRGLAAQLRDDVDVERVILIGVSVGGLIALATALAAPAWVARLALCDTGARIGSESFWAERIGALETHGMFAFADQIAARWFTPDFSQTQPAAYQGYRNLLTRTPLHGYLATCATLRDTDLSAAVSAIQAPALVLCGEADLATPPTLGQELAAALPNGHFALIPAAGHIPSLEQPAAVTAAMQAFFRGGD